MTLGYHYWPGIICDIVTFKTVGDKKLNEPPSGIVAKGLFTHELEVALSKGKLDCCIHSLKAAPKQRRLRSRQRAVDSL